MSNISQKTIENSSQVKHLLYDHDQKTLEVTFNTGKYKYYNVSVQEWEGLIVAESAGKYIAANIKNKYQFKRIE